jgi:hypothetical protein
MSSKTHKPKGKNGAWKTGQRVPVSGSYADQYGDVVWFEQNHTFPPCIGRKGENADRHLIENAAATA